jgi:hypothetical protein
VTNKRKALLTVAVAALLAVPGVAMASGAFDGGDGHAATIEEVTTTIDQSAGTDISDDSIGDLAEDSSTDPSGDLDEATEVEDSADEADDVAEMEDDFDDVDEAADVEDSADGPDDQSDDHAGGSFDDEAPDSDAGTAGSHS